MFCMQDSIVVLDFAFLYPSLFMDYNLKGCKMEVMLCKTKAEVPWKFVELLVPLIWPHTILRLFTVMCAFETM
ncbi:hypothetical protein KC19_VG323500 [Ceratodon purpureus]|uniref:Uncharacterized protein n=1 Tax=Ceratodon purpureus TaxID=3225 RepID=A0A8T0HWW0_CERPU|nr:hypothetical protein KC19_VG323500 [Ceratodon purpureus]